MLANIFLLLISYSVIKTVREPLILLGGGAEVRSYTAAGQALVLMGFVPLYSWFASRVDRVPREPGEAELEERVGPALRRAVRALVEAHPDTAGAGWLRRPSDAGRGERLDGKPVEVGEDLHVVVHDPVSLVVGNAGEVGSARGTVHHVRAGLVAPAVDARDTHARLVHECLGGHLVLQRPHTRDVDAFAAHAQLEPTVVALHIDEPHRTPPRLTLDRDDRPAEVVIDPAPDPHFLRLHAVTLTTTSAPSGGRAVSSAGADRPFGPHALSARPALDAPSLTQLVDEAEPAPTEIECRITPAERHVAAGVIDDVDADAVADRIQIQVDPHIRSRVAYHVAHELGGQKLGDLSEAIHALGGQDVAQELSRRSRRAR